MIRPVADPLWHVASKLGLRICSFNVLLMERLHPCWITERQRWWLNWAGMSGLDDDSNSLNSTAKANPCSVCACVCVCACVWARVYEFNHVHLCGCVDLCVQAILHLHVRVCVYTACVSVSVLTAKKPQQHLTWQLLLLSVQLFPSGSLFCDTIFHTITCL